MDWTKFLRFERKHGKKFGLINNTTVKYIRNSVMVNYNITMGLIGTNPFPYMMEAKGS
jgi:hypothetical protein